MEEVRWRTREKQVHVYVILFSLAIRQTKPGSSGRITRDLLQNKLQPAKGAQGLFRPSHLEDWAISEKDIIVTFNIMNVTKTVNWQQGLTISCKKRPRKNIQLLSKKFKTNESALCVNFSHNIFRVWNSTLCHMMVSRSLHEFLEGLGISFHGEEQTTKSYWTQGYRPWLRKSLSYNLLKAGRICWGSITIKPPKEILHSSLGFLCWQPTE